jgi:histone-lysine N-methyltransferase SETMAR
MRDNICQYVANVTMVMLTTMGWEVMNHPPYSPGLAWSEFNLFGLMRVYLGGYKFQTDNELKHGVLK